MTDFETIATIIIIGSPLLIVIAVDIYEIWGGSDERDY